MKHAPMFVVALLIAVLSSTSYHLIQKWTPVTSHPALTLLVSYAVALVACLIWLLVDPPAAGIGGALAQLNWTSYALGLAVTGIEVGFLLAYRAGWRLSVAAIAVNATVTMLLLPVGIIAFREHLSPANIAGVVLCLLGLVLINWR